MTPGLRDVAGHAVGAIGLGGASWSLGPVDRSVAAQTLRAALDEGVNLIDTALAYSTVAEPHHNERLIAETLEGTTSPPLIVTKGGHYRSSETEWPIDGSRDALRRHAAGSLAALGVDRIDLYLLHHPDPSVGIALSAQALRDLREEGLVAHVGLSNVSADQLDEAMAITEIDAVENRYSALDRGDDEMVRRTALLGVPYLAYSPLGGRGALTRLREQLVPLSDLAVDLGISTAGLLLAWLVYRHPHLVAIVGASSPASIADSAAVAHLAIPADTTDRIDQMVQRVRGAN